MIVFQVACMLTVPVAHLAGLVRVALEAGLLAGLDREALVVGQGQLVSCSANQKMNQRSV